MFTQSTCYLSPKLEGRLRPDGSKGVFACHPVKVGECLAVWGGEVVSWDLLAQIPPEVGRYSLQIEEGLYLVTSREGPADWVNHSCNPNAGLCGQVVLVAMRPIIAGEEICFDYAMSDGSPYDEFECSCGAATCRKYVTGNDWLNPELQEKYAGYFSPYIQRRINQLTRLEPQTKRISRNGIARRVVAKM